MDNQAVARVLAEIGTLLDLKGENPFKVRAYAAAARQIEALATPLRDLVAAKRLDELPGIGEALAAKIATLVETGHLPYYDELKASVPPGLLDLLRIPSVGPKKARALHERLGVTGLADLEAACRASRLLELDGFGKKSQERILEGIAFLARHRGRALAAEALGSARDLLAALEACPAVSRAALAGSLRRRRETVKDIDLLAASDRPAEAMDRIRNHPLALETENAGESKCTVRLVTGLTAELRVVPDADFPCALHHLTGSKDHNIAIRALAQKRGLTVSEWGVFRGEERLPVPDEAALFRLLGLDFIPPELREGLGEIEAAAGGRLPRLVEAGDLRGVLHVHSDWSDGVPTIEAWARDAKARGLEYLAICDHSAAASYAGGLTSARLEKQIDEIDAVNRRVHGVTVLKGIETDILPDGRVDMPEELLARLDVVVASVHSHFAMPEAEMTARICRAFECPHVDILGHPTGRLLLQRDGYPVDLEAVLQAAKRHGVAVELNAHPQRLDLDWVHLKRAKELGIRVAIDPDAHQPSGLDDVHHGIGIARKGWLEKGDVLNALPLGAFRKALRRARAAT
jgi:DNA polymerase (family 10)